MAATITAAPATALKARVRASVREQGAVVVDLAHDIHEHPELAFSEHYAAGRLTRFLADAGFRVRTPDGGLPTAFLATTGDGPVHIGLCAEYDALDEGIGHGCGHNLIAGAAVAAAIALRDVADEAGLTVTVIGTPGEELLGLKDPPAGHLVSGKIVLLEAGAFQGIDAVLMVHPGPSPYWEFCPSQAGIRIGARFASAGTGVLDATWALTLEDAIRAALAPLHTEPYFCRVAPERHVGGAMADVFIAAGSLTELASAVPAVRTCLEAAAAAAGVAVEIVEYTPNAELRNDPLLSAAFRANAEALGRRREAEAPIQAELAYLRRTFMGRALRDPRQLVSMVRMATHQPVGLFLDEPPVPVRYGTDLGQVSHVIPAIHPLIGIGGTASNNTAAFTPLADTEEAYRAMLDAAVALAQTAIDVATDAVLRDHVKGPRRAA